MRRKSKIILTRIGNGNTPTPGKVNYKVEALENRTTPVAGSNITGNEVDELLKRDRDLTVNIKRVK